MLGEGGEVAGIIGEGAHVRGNCRDGGFVGQVVPAAAEAFRRGQFHEAAARQIDGVVADGQHLLFGERGQVAGIVVKGAHVGRNSRNGRLVVEVVVIAGEQGRFVGQIVPAAAEAFRRGQFYEAAARQIDGIMADGQHLLFGERGQVACIIVKGADVGRNSRNGRFVGQIIPAAGEAFRRGQLHEAAVGQEYGVVADGQHLVGGDVRSVGDFGVVVSRLVGLFRPCRDVRVGFRIAGNVACIVGEGAHVGGNGVHGDVVRIVVKGANVGRDIRNCRDGIHCDVTRVVGEGTDVGGDCRDSRFVGQVVVIAAGGDGREVRFVREAVVVAVEQIRLVGQVIPAAAEAGGQLHESAVGQEYRVVADAQHLVGGDGRSVCDFGVVVSRLVGLFRPCRDVRVGFRIAGDVAGIVGEGADVGGNGVHGDVVRIVGKGAHVGGDCRDSRFVGQVVVVAAGCHRGEVRLVD